MNGVVPIGSVLLSRYTFAPFSGVVDISSTPYEGGSFMESSVFSFPISKEILIGNCSKKKELPHSIITSISYKRYRVYKVYISASSCKSMFSDEKRGLIRQKRASGVFETHSGGRRHNHMPSSGTKVK